MYRGVLLKVQLGGGKHKILIQMKKSTTAITRVSKNIVTLKMKTSLTNNIEVLY